MNDEERRAEINRLRNRQRAAIKANLEHGIPFEIVPMPEPTFEQRWGPLAPLIKYVASFIGR